MDSATLTDAAPSSAPGLSAKAIVGIVVLALLTVVLIWRARVLEVSLQRESEGPALVNKAAPDFTAQTLDGRTVSLADFRGQKNVVLSFWASWCGPCRMEMPGLIRFYQKHHSTESDFEILAVTIDEDTKSAEEFATAEKLNFPVLLDSRRRVADAYGVDGIPTMFVIDKTGKVVYGHEGFDMAMEFALARELGIQVPKPGEAP
jgi:peroxiredoxin